MADTENLADKFGRLLNTVKGAGEKLAQALEEENIDFDTFNSIHRETLNFDLLEEDIKNIHNRIEQNGYSVLGSRLILDDKKELIEIKIYSQKGEKSFVNTVSAKVKRGKNIPPDILDEIKSKGRVELNLKFDD
ncbi:MAG: hypothetical protein U7127_27525 [Phormidium sp.]